VLGTRGGVYALAVVVDVAGQDSGGRDGRGGARPEVVGREKDGFRDIGNLGGTGPTDGAIGNDINERGDVTGKSITAAEEEHAFCWSEAVGMLDLGTLGGGSSVGIAINSARQVAGRSRSADGHARAFLWTSGDGMRDLGTLAGGQNSIAHALNNRGQVAGRSDVASGEIHAVVWTPSAP